MAIVHGEGTSEQLLLSCSVEDQEVILRYNVVANLDKLNDRLLGTGLGNYHMEEELETPDVAFGLFLRKLGCCLGSRSLRSFIRLLLLFIVITLALLVPQLDLLGSHGQVRIEGV